MPEAGSGSAGVASTAGALSIADADAGERGFAAVPSLAGTYGTFTFTAATGAWKLELENPLYLWQKRVVGEAVSGLKRLLLGSVAEAVLRAAQLVHGFPGDAKDSEGTMR